MLPTIEENPSGLHQRYVISKANGEPVDPNAIYFVLRIDEHGDDPSHLNASREAARAYAEAILRDLEAGHLEDLATDLIRLLNDVESRSE